MIKISSVAGVSAFYWKTTEQVYPLELGLNGEKLYARRVNFGGGPNTGYKTVAHGITGITKLYRLASRARDAGETSFSFYPQPNPPDKGTMLSGDLTNIYTYCNWNYSATTLDMYVIYYK